MSPYENISVMETLGTERNEMETTETYIYSYKVRLNFPLFVATF